jgi:hypothetical protein
MGALETNYYVRWQLCLSQIFMLRLFWLSEVGGMRFSFIEKK